MVLGYTLIGLQALILVSFLVFGFYSVLYAIYSLRKPKIATAEYSEEKVAVVIVSFNEKSVLRDTIEACDKLSYKNKTIIVGDDSNDPETIDLLKSIAFERNAKRVTDAEYLDDNLEVYEGDGFVLYHRHKNIGFKAGNLKSLEKYLKFKGYEYMYLLDSDWHAQEDTIERCMETMAVSEDIGYVQTKRLYYHGKYDHFQRCLALNEESCYVADLAGRQNFGDMVLFSGCCALFKLDRLIDVGGFQSGHLTEDIDLSNRFYLKGYKGVYLEDVSNMGEVPPNYKTFMRQQERWTIGSARTFKEYFIPILTSGSLSIKPKLGLLRQNAYFTVSIAVELSIFLSILVGGIFLFSDTFPDTHALLKNTYLEYKSVFYSLVIAALLSNLVQLFVTIYKRKKYINILFLPLSIWISWSILHIYFIANLKGFLNVKQTWVVTPKTNRKKMKVRIKSTWYLKLLNFFTLVVLVGSFYWAREDIYLILPFVVLWVPALLIATVKS